jgi:hypothetical protein
MIKLTDGIGRPLPLSEYKKIIKRSHTKREESVQIQVANYIKARYPDVIFTSDSSGVRLNMGQAKVLKAMRAMDCKIPDMLIFEPRGPYKGLFLELKREGEKVFKADGTPYSGHLFEQWKTLERLKSKGYQACFAIGFEHAKTIIDQYMAAQNISWDL